MRRHELTDEQFERIKYFLPGRKGYVGATAKDNKLQNIAEMARREKRLKNWCRKWKLNLIEGFNPTWRDLYEEISA